MLSQSRTSRKLGSNERRKRIGLPNCGIPPCLDLISILRWLTCLSLETSKNEQIGVDGIPFSTKIPCQWDAVPRLTRLDNILLRESRFLTRDGLDATR